MGGVVLHARRRSARRHGRASRLADREEPAHDATRRPSRSPADELAARVCRLRATEIPQLLELRLRGCSASQRVRARQVCANLRYAAEEAEVLIGSAVREVCAAQIRERAASDGTERRHRPELRGRVEREDAPGAVLASKLLASELLASVLLAVDTQLHADLNGLTSRKKGRHKRALDPRQPWRAASVVRSHQRVIPARVRVAGDVSARKSPIASGEAREPT